MNTRATNPAADDDETRFEQVCRFVIQLGLAAQRYGCTQDRLRAFLIRVTETFGYRGTFASSPSYMLFAFQHAEDRWQRQHIEAIPPQGLDLDKLARVGDLVDALERGETSLADAPARLAAIDETPAPWGEGAGALAYAAIGAGVAAVLSGTWFDVAVATFMSLVVYGVVLWTGRRSDAAQQWLPLTTAAVSGVLAVMLRMWIPELNVVLVVLASVAVLLPGYTVSLGVHGLVNGHVLSGMANLMRGLVVLAKQVAGAWIGVGLALAVASVPEAVPGTPLAPAWIWFFVVLLSAGLCVAFQTGTRDFLAACAGCIVAYGGIALGSALVGSNLGNLLGTIIAVAFANLWARKTGRPTSIVLLPAIILLVSGSIGFRGLVKIAEGDVLLGTQQFVQMFVVAATISLGLLVGNSLFRPKLTL